MQNKLTNLNNHLFEQIENLREATGDELQAELQRSEQMAKLATCIIGGWAVALKAVKLVQDGVDSRELPKELQG